MTLLKVLHFPDTRLKNVGAVVTDFGADLQTLIDDMFETMEHENGVGLAATQVGIALQLAVIDPGDDINQPMVMINPEVSEMSDLTLKEEGCLSVPGYYDKVQRALRLKLKAQDRHGKTFEIVAEGSLAHIIQHETDHLNGKLFIDYLSPLKRSRIREKLIKSER